MAFMIILIILAIIISIGALVISLLSYKRSKRMDKIDKYFEYGVPEEIELQIEYEKQDLEDNLKKIYQKYTRMRKAAETEFTRRNMTGKPLQQMLQKIEREETEKMRKAEKTTERNIELLEVKKDFLEKLE